MTSRVLRWTGALGIAAVAIVRCVVVFAPQIVFDIDPVIDPTPLPGLGPAGSLFLDALLLAACGCGLLGEALAGRGIDWRLLVLALVPMPVIAWHGLADMADLWRGSTWLAAAAACAVLAHLGRDRSIRVVVVALLAAVLVPVAIRGAIQSSISPFGVTLTGPEYLDTIAEFEANRDRFFADRGWEPGSSQARLFEQRLRQPDPRGWFPTSNIFASLMAFGLIMATGLGIGAVRDRLGMRWLVLFGLAASVCAGALWVSRSKGAILAAAVGMTLLAVTLAGRRARAVIARRGGVVMLALVGLALAAVVARGAALPESWMGDKSLLYRWHYLVGSARIVSGHPLLGVGPGGFQAAYAAARLPRSPEEVTSAHNMFADWLSDLGLSGAAWVGLVGVLVWRAGRRLDPDAETADAGSGFVPARTTLAAATAVTVVALIPAIIIESAAIDSPAKELARIGGALCFVLAALALGRGLERTRAAVVNWTLAAAAVVLVIHGQIEMTFYDPGSVTLVMCMLGLAGPVPVRPGENGRRRAVGIAVAAGLLLAAALLSSTVAAAAARAQSLMIEATKLVYPAAQERDQRAWQRRQAAGLLVRTYREYLPTDAVLLRAAVRQLMIAAEFSGDDTRRKLAGRAVALAREAADSHAGPVSMALLAEASWLLAATTGDDGDRAAAIDAAVALTDLDPHGIGPWRRLGDVTWELGLRDEAASAYRRALENDANFELDPIRQLSDRDREAIRKRIEGR